MSQKFFTTRGSLVQCVKEDFLDADGYFLQNKIFFKKDYLTKQFVGYHRNPYQNLHIVLSELGMMRDYNELDELLKFKLLYKLTSNHLECEFQFQMFIKNALETDIFSGINELIVNTCYYMINDRGLFEGPKYITINDNPEKFKSMVENQKILVLSTKQLLEPFKSAAA